jgi:hypothetical protein
MTAQTLPTIAGQSPASTARAGRMIVYAIVGEQEWREQ